MAFSLKLDGVRHDLVIKNGKFVYIYDADQVRQKIKIALWHYYQEYFLNRPAGVPWYDILGSKSDSSVVSNIIRKKVLEVPGVLGINSFEIKRVVRNYFVDMNVTVQTYDGDTIGTELQITGLNIGN